MEVDHEGLVTAHMEKGSGVDTLGDWNFFFVLVVVATM